MAKKPAPPKKKPQSPLEEKIETVRITNKPVTPEATGSSDRHLFSVEIDGRIREVTGPVINTAIQRGQEVVIPKGTKFEPEAWHREASNCKGCGKR